MNNIIQWGTVNRAQEKREQAKKLGKRHKRKKMFLFGNYV